MKRSQTFIYNFDISPMFNGINIFCVPIQLLDQKTVPMSFILLLSYRDDFSQFYVLPSLKTCLYRDVARKDVCSNIFSNGFLILQI